MLQIGQAEDEEKPKFAPMPSGRKIGDVTLEEALTMFKLPRVVGKTAESEEITANIGRFGPYVKVGDSYVSIKDEDPFSIDETTARKLIVAKRKADALMADAHNRIGEDIERAKTELKKDMVELVATATGAIIHEKVTAQSDGKLIQKILEGAK
jgi:DNA topoisomerase-1